MEDTDVEIRVLVQRSVAWSNGYETKLLAMAPWATFYVRKEASASLSPSIDGLGREGRLAMRPLPSHTDARCSVHMPYRYADIYRGVISPESVQGPAMQYMSVVCQWHKEVRLVPRFGRLQPSEYQYRCAVVTVPCVRARSRSALTTAMCTSISSELVRSASIPAMHGAYLVRTTVERACTSTG